MKVAEILKDKGTRIITVRLREPIETAMQILSRENVGALVVKDVCRTEGNVVVGMFSERDVVRALAEKGPKVLQMTVEELMSKTIISCSPDDDLDDVIELMDQHKIRHLPVLEEQALIGVVSIRDVVHMVRQDRQRAAAALAAG